MGQCRGLRRTGGAGGELDIDRVIRLQQPGQFIQPRPFRRSTKRQNVAEPEISGLIGVSEMNGDRQMRQPRSPQRTRRAMLQFRREFSQNANVIGCFEPVRRDQCPALDLVQRVFQFPGAVARIDVHQDQPRLGGGVLRQHPLDPVGRPEPDPVARFQAQGDQAGGETIGLATESGEGQAGALIADHDGLLVRPTFGGLIQGAAKRVIEERNRRRAMEVALDRCGHVSLPAYPLFQQVAALGISNLHFVFLSMAGLCGIFGCTMGRRAGGAALTVAACGGEIWRRRTVTAEVRPRRDRQQAVTTSLADRVLVMGRLASSVSTRDVATDIARERSGQQFQAHQDSGEMLFPVSEAVLKVVALSSER